MSKAQNNRMNVNLTNWVKQNTEWVLSLPEPGDSWRVEEWAERIDIGTSAKARIQKFNILDLVEKDEFDPGPPTQSASGAWLWKTNPDAYQLAEDLREANETLPCDHRNGFVTLDADVGIYECGVNWCERRYGRQVIEKVFF